MNIPVTTLIEYSLSLSVFPLVLVFFLLSFCLSTCLFVNVYEITHHCYLHFYCISLIIILIIQYPLWICVFSRLCTFEYFNKKLNYSLHCFQISRLNCECVTFALSFIPNSLSPQTSYILHSLILPPGY